MAVSNAFPKTLLPQDVAADVALGRRRAFPLRRWVPHLPSIVNSDKGDFERPRMIARHLWERGTAKRSISRFSFLVIRLGLESVLRDDLSVQTFRPRHRIQDRKSVV